MKNNKPHILVTNDDGIDAKGLRLLINIARSYGKVIVVAPDTHQSAKSHSITQNQVISYKKIEQEEDYVEYSCSGTPVDCIKIALHEILDNNFPDLVLSGINHGTNTSVSVLYSGTMAAAIEGALNGIQSVGFSVNNYKATADFSVTEPYIRKIIDSVLAKPLPPMASLNVNFPNVEEHEIKGMKICRGAKGNWIERFVSAQNPFGKKAVWITGDFKNEEPEAKDTDEWAVQNGYASIVPTKPEFTYYEYIRELKGRF